MESITIVLPVPDPVLSPNSRSHFRVVAKAKKHLRALTSTLAREAMGRNSAPNWPTARVDMVVHFRDRRRRDRDNLVASLKAAFDGLEDANVIADDYGFAHFPPVIGEPDKSNPRIIMTISATWKNPVERGEIENLITNLKAVQSDLILSPGIDFATAQLEQLLSA